MRLLTRHALRPAAIFPRLHRTALAHSSRLPAAHTPTYNTTTTTTTSSSSSSSSAAAAMLHTAKQPAAAGTADSNTTSTTTTSNPAPASKLIFAPGDAGPASQAGQFHKGALERGDLADSPLAQFHAWFGAAQAAGTRHAETATLATAQLPSGRVSARVVYLKELDGRGFVVYSNWGTSRKAADVASNPQAALSFWWEGLERQVRVEGPVERLGEDESQVYFDTRIRGSRVGAWASRQSEPLEGREVLEGRVREVEARFEGQERIPVPPFWGGIRIVPREVEFWQGRESRLHDRFRYTKDDSAEGGWKVERLNP